MFLLSLPSLLLKLPSISFAVLVVYRDTTFLTEKLKDSGIKAHCLSLENSQSLLWWIPPTHFRLTLQSNTYQDIPQVNYPWRLVLQDHAHVNDVYSILASCSLYYTLCMCHKLCARSKTILPTTYIVRSSAHQSYDLPWLLAGSGRFIIWSCFYSHF